MAALNAIEGKSANLVPHLVANRMGDPRQIAVAAAHEFGVPLLDLDAVDLDLDVVKLVDEKLLLEAPHPADPATRQAAVHRGLRSDEPPGPRRDQVPDDAAHRGGRRRAGQARRTRRARHRGRRHDDVEPRTTTEGFDLENLEVTGGDEEPGGDVTSSDIDDAPIVRFVNKVMVDAIKKGASDIHFEPYEKHFRIRLRQDGVLTEIARPPVALAMKVSARLKVMARLDIAERRIPQDGRIKMKLSKNRAIDFRVNTCPTLFGEKVVCRLLDPSSAQLGIDALGYEEAPEADLPPQPGEALRDDPGDGADG